jgi:hypothetical protein
VSAPTSRLAIYMCDRLGHRNWKAFVKHTIAHYKDRYVRAFVEQPHVCVGPLDGAGCPHPFRVDLDSSEAGRMLGHLHLDHDHPVHQTCFEWSEKLPLQPQSWDDCVDGQKRCHVLFGVPDVPMHFRCQPCCLHFDADPAASLANACHTHSSSTATCHTIWIPCFCGWDEVGGWWVVV